MSFADHQDFLPQATDYRGGPLVVAEIATPRRQPFMCAPFFSPEGCSWPDCSCPPDPALVTEILKNGKW